MAASEGFRNAGFICGLQSEARCLAAAGMHQRIGISGARTARAAEVARELLAAGAGSLVSIGLAGGLDPRLGPGSVVVAERVLAWHRPLPSGKRRSLRQSLAGSVLRPSDMEEESAPDGSAAAQADGEFTADAELRSQLLGLLGGKVLSGAVVGVDQAVREPNEKLGLLEQTAALVCDMESHAVAEAAHEVGVPFAALRIVSDPSNRYIPVSALAGVTAAGGVSVGAVIGAVALRPWEVIDLLSLALDARIAFAALRRVARLGAPLFGAAG
ncbi:MAG: hypothetical protein QF666_16840 [Alphaproteobacteria bacterium]|jgi:nucleoside phosphorylase|nr:hypothetical protein [Alphaproteobacteria bacterium]